MPHRNSSAVDDLDDAAQPRCPDCGVLMRDVPEGWVCPSFGHQNRADLLTDPMPNFDGHSIHGGEQLARVTTPHRDYRRHHAHVSTEGPAFGRESRRCALPGWGA
jgi:hypothetical protein